jgi:hypothetical protein
MAEGPVGRCKSASGQDGQSTGCEAAAQILQAQAGRVKRVGVRVLRHLLLFSQRGAVGPAWDWRDAVHVVESNCGTRSAEAMGGSGRTRAAAAFSLPLPDPPQP